MAGRLREAELLSFPQKERPFVPHIYASVSQLPRPTGLHILIGANLPKDDSAIPPHLLQQKEQQQRDDGYRDEIKVGLTNISFDKRTGNVVVDTFPTTYGQWYLHPTESNPKIKEWATMTASSVVWLTTEPDGSHMVALAEKSSGNHSYRGMLTAGSTGSDAAAFQTEAIEPSLPKEGDNVRTLPLLEPVTEKTFIKTALMESLEELGLPYEDIKAVTTDTTPTPDGLPKFMMTSLVNGYGHTDAVFVGVLPTSAAEVQSYQQILKNKVVSDDPIDTVVFINAKDIPTVITQNLTPLHVPTLMGLLDAQYLLTYTSALATQSPEQAASVARGEYHALLQQSQKSLEEMESIAYTAHRKRLAHIAQEMLLLSPTSDAAALHNLQKERTQLEKYLTTIDPCYTPQEQGLSSPEDALHQLGILQDIQPSFLSPRIDSEDFLSHLLESIYPPNPHEAPLYMEMKKAYMRDFLMKDSLYPQVFHFYQEGNLFTPENSNIIRHNLTAMVYADILCDMLDITGQQKRDIVFTAGIHDFGKILEKEQFRQEYETTGTISPQTLDTVAQKESALVDKILRTNGITPKEGILSLIGANIPQQNAEGKIDVSSWSLGQKLIWYIDATLYDERIMTYQSRFKKDRRSQQTYGEQRGALAQLRDDAALQKYGLPYLFVQERVGDTIFSSLILQLAQMKNADNSPRYSFTQLSDITAYIKRVYIDRVKSTVTPIPQEENAA